MSKQIEPATDADIAEAERLLNEGKDFCMNRDDFEYVVRSLFARIRALDAECQHSMKTIAEERHRADNLAKRLDASQAAARLDAALCQFLNCASDKFDPIDKWRQETRDNLEELSEAYNAAHEAGLFLTIKEYQKFKPQHPLGIPIGESEILWQVAKRLEAAGYKTLLDLHQASDDKLFAIERIGRRTLADIREVIQKVLYA